jgi:hypothetical protein
MSRLKIQPLAKPNMPPVQPATVLKVKAELVQNFRVKRPK